MFIYCSLKNLEKDNKGGKRVVNGKQGVFKNFVAPTSIIGEGIGTDEEFGSNWYQEMTKGL
jgi:hypothetical protein